MNQDSVLRWLFKVPGREKTYILALTVVQILHGMSGVFYALLLRSVVDAAVDKGRELFIRFSIFLVLLVIAQLLLRAMIRWLNELSKSSIENVFKHRLMMELLHKDYLKVNATHTGDWMNRMTNDAMIVANGYVEIIPGLAGMIVKLFSALVMMVALEPRFAAIIIPGGCILLLLTWLFRKILKPLHKEIQEEDGRLRIFLQERISSMFLLRSYATEESTLNKTDVMLQRHQSARMKKNHFSNLCNFGFGSAMNAMYLFGVIWCGYGILNGSISFGTLTAITQLISQIQTPFSSITGYMPRYYSMIASAERLMEVEAYGEENEEPKSFSEIQSFYEKDFHAIGFDHVSFAYYPNVEDVSELSKDDMPAVLEDISFEIRKGDYVAFTGQSGCGKSTALKLLMCVYGPDSGERFYIDRKGNRGQLTSVWRRLFAYVPQGNHLMNGTIRDVVSFSDPDSHKNDERLKNALKIACAEEFVNSLPEDVDSLLGERGAGISEGQMQRLAIARAVYSECPVLLLDEATSALDETTEKQLLENLRSMTDKTVIIVTHRPAAREVCNRVFHFDNGRMEER